MKERAPENGKNFLIIFSQKDGKIGLYGGINVQVPDFKISQFSSKSFFKLLVE